MTTRTNSLLVAVMTGDAESARDLIVYTGEDANQKDQHGCTPLMIASLHGQCEVVKILMDKGAAINETCENTTALMFAASISSFELDRVYSQVAHLPCYLLLVTREQHHCTPDRSTGAQFSSSESFAVCPKSSKLTGRSRSLLSSSDDDDRISLLKKILENKTKVMECLLHAGADPNIRDESGRNALILVTENDPSKCFRSMFKKSVPAMVLSVANTELKKRCQYLIDYHVDINTTDNDGMTALMHAVKNRLYNVTELLLHHNADVNIVDNQGNTALTYFVLTGSKHLLCLLLQRRGDADIQKDLRPTTSDQDFLEKTFEMCKMLSDETETDVNGTTFVGTRKAVGCRKKAKIRTERTTSQKLENSVKTFFDNLNNELGRAILMIAVTKNSFEVCRFVLDNEGDPDVKDNDSKTVLMNAILKRSADVCNLLLYHGAQPDLRDVAGKTALMYAFIQGLSDFADVLISYGADVNLQDATGMTALMYAIHCKMDDCCQLLLRHGADVNLQEEHGRTSLMLAVSANYDCCTVWLIENGADLNLKDYDGRTALMYAALNDSAQSCKLIVEGKADLNIQDKDGMTAVLHCAQKSLKDPLSVLLSAGANPDLCDFHGTYALWQTLIINSLDCFKLLVGHGANINRKDRYDDLPLIFCIKENLKDHLKILVNAGANLELKNKENVTALEYSIMHKRPDFCKLLVDHGADVNVEKTCTDGMTLVIYCATRAYLKDYLDILLTGEPDLDLTDDKHFTALMHASRNDLPDICEVLVLHGADMNRQDIVGMSSVMHAVLENSYQCIERFLSLGMDSNKQMGRVYLPNDTDGGNVNVTLQDLGRGKSAFQLAVILDSDEMCKLMMSYGADVNKQDRDGRTALMYAALHNSSKCFQLLIEYADLTVEDKNGRTVLFYATNPDFIQKMQQKGLEVQATDEEEKDSVLSLLMKDVNLFMHLQRDGVVIKMLVQVRIILENGVSPILEPSERGLLHKANSLQLPLHRNEDYLKPLHLETCIENELSELLRLLVCNGVVPTCGSQSSICYPVMQKVLEKGDEEVFKYLIANCYLTDQDVAYMRDWGQYRNMANAHMEMPEQMMQHPWPLVKLAFISVSTALGAGPGREARVSKTGLPVKLQDMLLFRQPAAQIPVREWEDIEFCFDPVKYEELPRPRPLLYYWPLGQQL